MDRRKAALAIGIAAVAAVGIGAGLFRRGQPEQSAAAPMNAAQTDSGASDVSMLVERTRGNPAAPITIFEFSDFQCPYCRQFSAEILPALEREYLTTGKARLVFINYPIPQLHANATAAHNFAMCAARQNQFWPVHDLLFRHQRQWEKLPEPGSFFRKLADSVSVGRRQILECLDRKAEDWLVQAEAQEARNAGVSGTPAFVINGGLLPGMQPMEVWRPILDSIYRAGQK